MGKGGSSGGKKAGGGLGRKGGTGRLIAAGTPEAAAEIERIRNLPSAAKGRVGGSEAAKAARNTRVIKTKLSAAEQKELDRMRKQAPSGANLMGGSAAARKARGTRVNK